MVGLDGALSKLLPLGAAARLHLFGAGREAGEDVADLLLHGRRGTQAGVRGHLLADPGPMALSALKSGL